MCEYSRQFFCLCTICILPKLEMCDAPCDLCEGYEIEHCRDFFPDKCEYYERLTNIDHGDIKYLLTLPEAIAIKEKRGKTQHE